MMTFEEYERLALRTAAGKSKKNELFHLVLGLVGETGEIAEKMKKWVRDQASDESLVDVDDLKKELGDVLWYTAVLAAYFDIPFGEIAEKNIAKLEDRQKRNVLAGSGDNR